MNGVYKLNAIKGILNHILGTSLEQCPWNMKNEITKSFEKMATEITFDNEENGIYPTSAIGSANKAPAVRTTVDLLKKIHLASRDIAQKYENIVRQELSFAPGQT